MNDCWTAFIFLSLKENIWSSMHPSRASRHLVLYDVLPDTAVYLALSFAVSSWIALKTLQSQVSWLSCLLLLLNVSPCSPKTNATIQISKRLPWICNVELWALYVFLVTCLGIGDTGKCSYKSSPRHKFVSLSHYNLFILGSGNIPDESFGDATWSFCSLYVRWNHCYPPAIYTPAFWWRVAE